MMIRRPDDDRDLRQRLATARPDLAPSVVAAIVAHRDPGATLDDLLDVVREAEADHAADLAHESRLIDEGRRHGTDA